MSATWYRLGPLVRSRNYGTNFLPMLAVTLSLVFLVGCTADANRSSIFRTYQPATDQKTQTALVDAKQRALFSAPGDFDEFDLSRKYIICAEPSPDAVSALSSAFSTSFDAGFLSSGTGSGALAQALSEAVGKLGKRNATIQLLRDSLYRQCEAYMNGMISSYDYIRISDRYVDAMVTLLAIEQVTSPGAGDKLLSIQSAGVSADSDITTRPTNDTKGPVPSAADSKETLGKDPKSGSSNGAKHVVQETNAKTIVKAGGGVELNLSELASSTINENVAKQVTEMLRIFLGKDTRDRCIERLDGLLNELGHDDDQEITEEERKLIGAFVGLCTKLFGDEFNFNPTLSGVPNSETSGN